MAGTEMVNTILAVVIGIILIATVGLAGLNIYFSANTSAFDSSTLAIWGVIGIIAVVAMFILILPVIKKR